MRKKFATKSAPNFWDAARVWFKREREMKMINLTATELEFLANSGGRTKKKFVKELKLKYGVQQ